MSEVVVWENLPYSFGSITNPLMINRDEFIVVIGNFKPSKRGIFKFNMKSKEWNKIMDFETSYPPAYTFNKQTNTLYICAKYLLGVIDRNIVQIVSLNQKHLTKGTNKLRLSSYGIIDRNIISNCVSEIIYINKTLHIITENVKHYIYNIETKESKMVYKFEEFQNDLDGAGFIYLKRRQSIILLGGYAGFTAFNSIYEYSLLSNKWNKLNVKLSVKLSHFAVVSTRFDQYIIILGGWIDGLDASDDIYIFDIKHAKLMKSKMKCHFGGYTKGIITDNTYNDELLTFGFVNSIFKTDAFYDIQPLPHYLIQLISTWVCNQHIHIIQNNSQTGGAEAEHCRINVDDIFNA
eukprot:261653_1